MHGSQGVTVRRVIGSHGTKILGDEKGGAAGDRLPNAGPLAGTGKRAAIRAVDAEHLPGRDGAYAARLGIDWKAHLVAPAFVSPVATTLEQVLGRACKGIVGRAERRNLAIAVGVDAHGEPDLGHPLV